MFRLLSTAFLITLVAGSDPAKAQPPVQAPPKLPAAPARPARPTPPTRDPHTPGYVTAKELPDGDNAPAKADGNFILGPTHNPAPEMTVQEGVPQGTVYNFTMESTDSKIYPGIAREPDAFGTAGPRRPGQAGRHDQPPCSVHPQSGCVRPETIRPRHGCAVHRRGGWTRQGSCSRPWTI